MRSAKRSGRGISPRDRGRPAGARRKGSGMARNAVGKGKTSAKRGKQARSARPRREVEDDCVDITITVKFPPGASPTVTLDPPPEQTPPAVYHPQPHIHPRPGEIPKRRVRWTLIGNLEDDYIVLIVPKAFGTGIFDKPGKPKDNDLEIRQLDNSNRVAFAGPPRRGPALNLIFGWYYDVVLGKVLERGISIVRKFPPAPPKSPSGVVYVDPVVVIKDDDPGGGGKKGHKSARKRGR
jgi:hypothetical protein